MNSPKTPSGSKKKTTLLIVVVVSLLIVGGAGFYKYSASKKIVYDKERAQAATEQIVQQTKEEFLKDSDGDGLKDWEEALWKTSPNNPDTDGDGTPDGEEVKQNRDPAVAGPNDEIKEVGNVNVAGVLDPNKSQEELIDEIKKSIAESDSLTEKVFKAQALSYLITEKGEGFSEEGKQAIKNNINKLVSLDISEVFLPAETPMYTKDDLRIVDNTVENFQAYKTGLFTALENYKKEYAQEDDIDIIKDIVVNKRIERIKDLDKKMQGYIVLAKQLQELSIPDDPKFIEMHLLMINIMSSIVQALENIKYTENDPLRGLIGVSQFQQYYDTALYAIADVVAYVNDKTGPATTSTSTKKVN